MLLSLLAAAAPVVVPAGPAPQLPVPSPGVIVVEDMNELRALPVLPVNRPRAVRVLGYHAPDDRCGGEFWWDAASIDTDDGGTVILPDSSPSQGRWKRLRDGRPVSVAWFGATPDDGTDDFLPLQQAIDHAQQLTGGLGPDVQNASSLYVPPGAYHVSGTLRINDALDLHGDDASSTVLVHTSEDVQDLLQVINDDKDADGEPDALYDVSIRRLTLLGNGEKNGQSSQTRFGLFMFHGIRGCSVEDVTVLRCQTGIFLRRCYTANVIGSTVMFCAQHALKWENATAGMISGSRFDVAPGGSHCAFVSFDHTNGQETLGFLVESSSFQGSSLAGLYARDVSNLSVVSCFFENNNRDDLGFGALHLEDVVGQPYDQEEHVLNVLGGFFSPGEFGGNSSRAIYVENTRRVNLIGTDIRGKSFEFAIDIRSNVGFLNLVGNEFHGLPRKVDGGVSVEEMGSD